MKSIMLELWTLNFEPCKDIYSHSCLNSTCNDIYRTKRHWSHHMPPIFYSYATCHSNFHGLKYSQKDFRTTNMKSRTTPSHRATCVRLCPCGVLTHNDPVLLGVQKCYDERDDVWIDHQLHHLWRAVSNEGEGPACVCLNLSILLLNQVDQGRD